LGLIFIGFLIAGFFGLRALFALRDFGRYKPLPFAEAFTEQAYETDVELIRDWMTIPYISKAYHVHPGPLYEALGISSRGNEEKSLLQLNEEFFSDKPGIVIELIKAVVDVKQPAHSSETSNPP